MRTNKEISYAVALLRQKGDRISLTQAEVLEKRLTEKVVFERYVANVPAEEKDEAVFFAARDAARYLAGGIALDEFIPDAERYPVEIMNESEPLGSLVLESLIKRVELLEKQVAALSGIRQVDVTHLNSADYSSNDFVTQKEACLYIGCSKVTLKSWTDKGLVNGYRKGIRVYYSKCELDASPTVKNFKNLQDYFNHDYNK